MKPLNIFAVTLFALLSCSNAQKGKTGANEPNSTDAYELYSESQLSSFAEAVKTLKNDPSVQIVDTCNQFAGKPFVICYMQFHLTDNNVKVLSEDEKQLTLQSQSEILKSLRPLTSLPIYSEGFLTQDGRIDTREEFDRLVDSSIYSPLTFFLLNNLKSISLYGTEDGLMTGRMNSIFSLRYTYQNARKQYSELRTQEEQLNALNIFATQFDNLFKIDNRPGQKIFENPAIYKAYDDEMNSMHQDLIKMKNSLPNSPDGHFALLLEMGKYLDQKWLQVTRFDRNIGVATALPEDSNSVLILGANHFKSFGNPSSLSSSFGSLVENLLVEQKLNYIILSPKSLLGSKK
jgi:hypothetical protein